MNTRLTRTVGSVSLTLAVLCGLFVIGKGAMHLFDDGAVCVQTGFWANAALENGLPVDPGVTASSSAARLCQKAPSFGQRAAGLGDELPWGLFATVALLLFARVLKPIVEQGPFTEAVSQRLTQLGWAVVLGAPLASFVAAWSHSWLVESMAPVVGSNVEMEGVLELVLPGLAALILGRIMREGVRMREDLEGTV